MVEVAHADPEKVALVRELQALFPLRPTDTSGALRVSRTGEAELHSEVTEEFLKANAQSPGHFEILRRLDLKSAMVVPLSVGNQTFGALTFGSDQPGRFGRDDLAFAQDVARHAAFAIQNAQLYLGSQSALRARDEVLRVVSHDLRNPINNISMTATLLLNVPGDRRASRGMLEIIKRGSQRMNHLIDDLIAVARVHAGQEIPLKVQAENPVSIVEEACETSKIEANSKSIRLTSEAPSTLLPVKADRDRVLQVLYNLIDNALKFTPAGGSVIVRCESFGRSVRFSVKDTGRGIDEAHVDRIFEQYWQAKATAHLGSGLGLTIAKTIVEQHGGKIWVESKPGIGSTFFFTLPHSAAGEQSLDQEKVG